ncbi:TPA: MFS transporter [Klebsiella variicola]|uniref:MFS transporter n=1 Tax=Klebsiella variicola TaxID=244366 RepID=UPI000E2C8A39|nr:MFS transporter [Klebsiella variicola]SXE76294.1 major facilitator superfamily transporter [Klebsiella variicola]HBQ0384061.1 MFS transporter [Klebsiella variicola]HCC2288151.1 MFS transporter [Klebsiella variicola]HDK6004647.1 MFS transporter [Klebsiella variicola]HDK6502108.1 MFS transporter [Klebsiella variicola]
MPFVVYIFTLSAFALGLAEFVPIGLSDVMASSLNVTVEQVGATVTAYALGATFSAPILTALTASWSRKNVMLVTALVFTLGSFVAAFASTLSAMVIARFVAGIGHGLFLAVAASTAAKLAGRGKEGRAVAVVFGGFTLAMAIGVPLSTWLGGVMAWRPVLAVIGVFGAIGFAGLLFGMKDPVRALHGEHSASAMKSIAALLNPTLLSAALVTVLSYAGSFTAYTYIAPMLTQLTGVAAASVGIFMLVYGVFAAIGNILGGKITDSLGVNRANILIVGGIIIIALGMWVFSGSAIMMGILVALLGMFTFGAVPALQARLISVASEKAPHAAGVASGLNIAGFNSGIALGSVTGDFTISSMGIVYTGLAGAVLSLLGLLLLLSQIAKSKAHH